jgi:hypothetical protein
MISISSLIDRLYAGAEKRIIHPSWIVRRAAQAVVMMICTIRYGARRFSPAGATRTKDQDLVDFLSSSERLRNYIFGPGFFRPTIGLLARALLARISFSDIADDRMRSDHSTFALRINGAIDQLAIRNLLIWQNQILTKYRGNADRRPIDVMLILRDDREEPRLFDFMSVTLMLPQLRNISVFCGDASADAAAPLLLSKPELAHWRGASQAEDILSLPSISGGIGGGLKLLADGRRRSNDFFKIALPHHVVIAVSLRELDDGRIDQSDLTQWIKRFADWRRQDETLAVVILNNIAPSQHGDWPSYVLIARDSGFSLPDMLGLVQFADAYCGVLDIFGLAAYSGKRPGIYIPLLAADRQFLDILPPEEVAGQIIAKSADDPSVDEAVVKFFTTCNLRTL